ncbi:hypothetical protein MACJ_003877 [Theileria orientalis]|uniref:Uncharacterized protein n=1 Tax=Theileria orientalis TaxID=68886 RepID=A0A976SKV8_THEOR|nr:hypothetical protein MACJ_003877 [Theileria orientalis]
MEGCSTCTNFDEKLREFETTASTVPFTYSPDWVLPSMTFDPKTSHRFYFQSSDQTEGLVTTTTYTPKEGTVVNNVLYDRSKVWPANEDGSGDTAKKLVHLKVLSKNDMVQLLQLRNALVATPNTTEDLYYKKVMDTYVKLDSENAFNDLKGTLSKEDTYVDQNVKLDLSSTEETSTKLFEKETTLEDGVEKTVVVVKAGKLFQPRHKNVKSLEAQLAMILDDLNNSNKNHKYRNNSNKNHKYRNNSNKNLKYRN